MILIKNCTAVEFEPPRRQVGGSRWSLGALFQMARRTVISFSSLPLRLVTWLGAFGLAFRVLLMLFLLFYFLRDGPQILASLRRGAPPARPRRFPDGAGRR